MNGVEQTVFACLTVLVAGIVLLVWLGGKLKDKP